MKAQRRLRLARVAGLLTVLSGGLAACCGSINCDCIATSGSEVIVSFDQDSARSGFRKAELRAAYVVRYDRPGFAAPLNTVQFGLTGTPYGNYVSLPAIGGAPRPGPPAAARSFADYNYRFVLPNASRTYELSNLEIKAGVGDDCCACPTNIRRRFVLNGQPVIADGNGEGVRTILRR